MINKKNIELLKKQHYGVVGKHSAVQICRWTKKSLVDQGECYKERFYGIKSIGCCEFSPSAVWCQNKCVHCWRAIESSQGVRIGDEDNPTEVLEGIVKARQKLLSGFKGNPKSNLKKLADSQTPSHFAISLVGEPTLYSQLPEMISEIRKRGATSFIVTNGLNPRILLKMEKKKSLPTQLYISLNSPNKKMYDKWHKSLEKEAWKKFNQGLEVMAKLRNKTRTVVRMTLVKGLNMGEENVSEYCKLIKKAKPLFIEIKGYMSVGYARKRLGYHTMPNWKEVQDYANLLASNLGQEYAVLGKHEFSRVVLVGKKTERNRMKIRINEK